MTHKLDPILGQCCPECNGDEGVTPYSPDLQNCNLTTRCSLVSCSRQVDKSCFYFVIERMKDFFEIEENGLFQLVPSSLQNILFWLLTTIAGSTECNNSCLVSSFNKFKMLDNSRKNSLNKNWNLFIAWKVILSHRKAKKTLQWFTSVIIKFWDLLKLCLHIQNKTSMINKLCANYHFIEIHKTT